MRRDPERLDRIKQALSSSKLDALVCSLPMNVLMISGYWPVIGNSVAIATRDSACTLVVPADEKEIAKTSGCEDIHTFVPASLNYLGPAYRRLDDSFQKVGLELGLGRARIGYESGEASVPASYSAIHVYQGSLLDAIRKAWPDSTVVPADHLLAQLRGIKTPFEIEKIRTACKIAEHAFDKGREQIRSGITELAAAAIFRAPLSDLSKVENVQRADGYMRCMAGSNSALAGAAYARSRPIAIDIDDLVLVHCNSYADGYWTDITRTYCIEPLDSRKKLLYAAVFDARTAAFEQLRPGVAAAEVDRAARIALKQFGVDRYFIHSTGHGVGFGAISPTDLPRLHPRSPDVLEKGMVFNIEPAVYLPGYGGIRHCDTVAITEAGAELLTPFHSLLHDLRLAPEYYKAA
jgi:Xaa-Pro aminopeptidase